jgi:hypothetical protein
MSVELDIASEVWLTCKEYINPKDRQAAADHVISVAADHNITESELKTFGGTDAYLGRAVKEYLGEEVEEVKEVKVSTKETAE